MLLDPGSVTAAEDPFAVLAAARQAHGSVFTDGSYVHVLAHEAVTRLLFDNACTTGFIGWLYRSQLPEGSAAWQEFGCRINFLDPPEHTRVRNLVATAFTPGRLTGLRPWVEDLAATLIGGAAERLRAGETVDLRPVAHDLPSLVVSELLGVPPADRDQLTEWADASVLLLAMGIDEATRSQAVAASEAFGEYLGALFAERRRSPHDDLLSALAGTEVDGERLAEPEVLSLALTLYSAGHRTTRDTYTMGMVALLDSPDRTEQWSAAAAEPARAVNELLRYCLPTFYVGRTTTAEVELHGVQIPAGAAVLPWLAAANRDPSVWDEPDRFDMRRERNRPVSFGGGIHHCLGAPLARMELEVLLSATLARLGGIALTEPGGTLGWWGAGPIRGLARVPVSL